MKKTIIYSIIAAALVGSSLVYAQSTEITTTENTSIVAQSTVAESVPARCIAPSQNLRFGDGLRTKRSQEVQKLQTILIEKGYLLGNATGYFGSGTFSAVKKFQKDHGLNATGYVGPLTIDKIKNKCQTPIAVCDYAAPPENCVYKPGPDYNKESGCGMVLSCENYMSYQPPTNCKSWYDGCNYCGRQSPGQSAFCTKIACIDHGDNGATLAASGKCTEYFETPTQTCSALGKTYTEGQSTGCINGTNSQSICIADAAYVCRSGIWKIEGGLPTTKPKEPVVYCTMEARLCSNGSMMPRGANCVWYPEQCPTY